MYLDISMYHIVFVKKMQTFGDSFDKSNDFASCKGLIRRISFLNDLRQRAWKVFHKDVKKILLVILPQERHDILMSKILQDMDLFANQLDPLLRHIECIHNFN